MARLLLFSQAREAAGRSSDVFDEPTLQELLVAATQRYGNEFERVAGYARVWVNGEPCSDSWKALSSFDEVAIIPPVAGG